MSEKQGLNQGPPPYDHATSGYAPGGYQPVQQSEKPYPGQPQYGQPGQPPYGQPGQPPYGQPGQPPYGQPGQPPYGQPGQPPYGQPGQPPYGQPGQPPYGQPGQPYTTQQVIVAQPGQAGIIVTQQRPPDYMIPSVLACLCCFCPTGLCAIYYASRANTLAQEGDMAEATRMSNNARNLMITSIVIGVAWIILVIILRLVVFATARSTYGYDY